MRSISVKRIGALVSGAAMLGAAVAGSVSATFDDTGLTKGFFYDSNYNPIVQIVVGEKGLAPDSVAAGNVAATVGNLAYMTGEGAAAGGTASGEVTIGVAATGATGKYEQERGGMVTMAEGFTGSGSTPDFYDDNDGVNFTNQDYEYQRGEFISYSLACDTQTRTEAGILKEGTYANVHCLFCETLCLGSLENPDHEMEEKIEVNASDGGIIVYEDGIGNDDSETLTMEIAKDSVRYILDAGEIPMTKIRDSAADEDDEIDFEWRGKMILFGEEYYVKDIDGTDEIDLAKGKILEDISSEGYTSEYMGYKFKIDHLIYSGDYEVAGILLDVEKPDGTVVQTQVSKRANGIIDDIEVAGVYAEESDAVATASLLVYDTTTNVHLEDGEDLTLGGETKDYWRTTLSSIDTGDSEWDDLETTEYEDATSGRVLDEVIVEYRHKAILEEQEELAFPSTFKLRFEGYRTTDYKESPCSGAGEGNIVIEKAGDYELEISFTDDNGNRHNAIGMHQGPYSTGDKFILGGNVYELDDLQEQNDDVTMEVKLRDLIDGGTDTYDLTAITSPSEFTYTTIPFQDELEDNDTYDIEPDDEQDDSDVYSGTILGVAAILDGSDLWLDVTNADQSVGVSSTQVGTIDEIEEDGNTLEIKVIEENGTGDLMAVPTSRTDLDDVILEIANEQDERVYVDLYDRDYDSAVDVEYGNAVVVTDDSLSATSPLAADDMNLVLDDDDDSMIILPEGGDVISVDWGGDYEVEAIEVCHPQEDVDLTIFIGTTEESTMMESVITEADVGAERTAGCCSFTVLDFAVAGEAGACSDTTVNSVGNLVVSEVAADASKNLVVVGGPSVNSMTTVTVEELQAASNQYIVKKDGKKLVVAGLEAADTGDAANALINWLKDNVH
jgi:S-layer protein (TIGR01564 family)